jgi:TolA-binding protein
MKDLISSKVICLPPPYRSSFDSLLKAHDKEVDKYYATLERAHRKLVSKQLQLAETFAYMIDDVVRLRSQFQGSQQQDTQIGD